MPNFAPNVTYNIPVVQPVQWKEVEKPDINIRPIDIGGIVSGISAKYVKEEEDKAKKEYQAGLNKYALELDRIVEGQRQGRYDQHQADRLMREATDNMIGLGWNAMDVAPVRDKYSGKVPELEQRRQTMIMEHQQEFEEKQIETFRAENPFYANESDATVKNIVGTLDNLERNVKYYNELALQGKTDAEIASYANQRIKSGEDLVAYNVFMDLKTMLNTPEALANMNQQQYDGMVHNLKLSLRDKYGYDQGMSDVIVDRAMNSIGADQVIKDVKDTYRNNTEWNKMAVENIDSSAQYAVRKIPAYTLYNALNPEARQAITLQKPTFVNDLYSDMEKTIENPDYAKASIKTLGASTVQDAGWATQIYTSLVGDRLKPTSYLAGLAVTGTKQAVDVLKNPFETTNEADRRTNLDNARKILNAYKDKDIDDMRRQAAMRGDTSTIAALDVAEQNLGYAKAVVTAYDQMQATPELRNLAASLQNQGTSRFRMDPETGKLLMTRKTSGALQTLGDLMASAETRQQVNKVNDLLESSSPAERKAYVTMMFNNDIADYKGEELWDTSKRSLKEMFADAANNLSSAATGLATFRSDPEAMKAIEENDEKAFRLLNERKIGVFGDRLLQRLRENPEQSERNAAIDAELQEMQQSPFTGEEIQASSKVSNKTTLSNAFVEAKPAVEGYESMIQQSAANHGVDPQYLDMIAAIESKRGKYTNASSAGAKGVMQFMPKTWREEIMPVFGFSEKDINDPQKAIEAGAWYIKQCENYAKSIKPDATAQELAEMQAACYNAGAGKVKAAVEKAGGDWERAKSHLTKETKDYIGYVKKYYNATDRYVEDVSAQDLEDDRLLQELADYINYDNLPDDLKRKYDARARIHARAEANRK